MSTPIQSNRQNNLDAYVAGTGVPVLAARNGAAKGLTLAPGTYYIPLGSSEAPLPGQSWMNSLHLQWTALFAATITVEDCNFPAMEGVGGSGQPDVLDYSDLGTTVGKLGDWIQNNNAQLPVQVQGANNAAAALTITAGGTNAGGAFVHLPNDGARRRRLKVIVTVAGVLRAGVHGKA